MTQTLNPLSAAPGANVEQVPMLIGGKSPAPLRPYRPIRPPQCVHDAANT